MTDDDMIDPVIDALRSLHRLCPDGQREPRVRARCHAALDRRRAQARQQDEVTRVTRLTAVGLTLAAVSYAIAVTLEALRLTRSL